MSLRDEIVPYLTTTGLVSNVVSTGQFRTADNHPLFTSEYVILLKIIGELTTSDEVNYSLAIRECIGIDGELHRAPGDLSKDEIDDNVGVLSAHIQLGILPTFKIPVRLWRFPVLLYLSALASQSRIRRVLATPFLIWTALVIATACLKAPVSDTDSRILSWLLVKGTEGSLLCRLAARVWRRRLMKDYANGMKDVFTSYFGAAHPLAKYCPRG